MEYETTFYWGHRKAAYQHAAVAAKVHGGSTYTETTGFWQDDDGRMVVDVGATVTVLHDGGPDSVRVNAFAMRLAREYGEQSVLRTTVTVRSAEFLEAN